MSLKAKIESVLFLTEKPVRAQAIARIVNEDVQIVRQAILELIHDYENRDGALEIADDDGYIIQVKDQYSSIIDEFLPMELPLALLRTLSAIALKQPVSQAEIIKIRGAGAYDHIKELLAREMINKKEDGRSPLLTTTKQFQDYFRLTQDAKSLRTELRKSDKKKPQEADGTTFDATPGVDGETDRLVVQLKLEDEAKGGSPAEVLGACETGKTAASAAGLDEERDSSQERQSGGTETTEDSGSVSRTSSVSLVETAVSEESETRGDTPALTIAPAAIDLALESMSDGSGDVG
ncbi:MAG: SMC-Scp complex subunit ScpB [Candidatus Melainabacteria bacterium]|nr:SMC-Scp complex subunit ScpB [Candidatus Melainabacteria bacterium]